MTITFAKHTCQSLSRGVLFLDSDESVPWEVSGMKQRKSTKEKSWQVSSCSWQQQMSGQIKGSANDLHIIVGQVLGHQSGKIESSANLLHIIHGRHHPQNGASTPVLGCLAVCPSSSHLRGLAVCLEDHLIQTQKAK